MVRTRYSTPEIAPDDPVVEIHESQLKRLRARANLAIPGAIMGLLALAAIAAGTARVEQFAKDLNALAEGRSGVVADRVGALREQLAARTDPEMIARIATETNVASIAGARTTARRALLAAREAAASVEPVTEQLALVDGQLVQMRSEIANLSGQGTTQAADLSKVSEGLDSLRSSHEERLESLTRQVAAHETRFDFQDQEAKSTKTWTRAAAVGAAFGIGIAASHALDHSGR